MGRFERPVPQPTLYSFVAFLRRLSAQELENAVERADASAGDIRDLAEVEEQIARAGGV